MAKISFLMKNVVFGYYVGFCCKDNAFKINSCPEKEEKREIKACFFVLFYLFSYLCEVLGWEGE
ncbi:hypothetical protein HMPREF0650_1902 [Hoylesella buccalis ATCC 35310]|uniref:Uncharacterized protein n=1 Tax=Hoylesella buccalis ATCC 35310 TaxID=679190 RepID=D1W7K7_9BACT|nr:hypothetical protein HMPREF0650_1902 [Hoylesella buccalis ATCC 35310]